MVTLGKNKTIQIEPWKTKAKRDFMKRIKEKGEKFTEDDLLETLVYPYIEPKDIYLNEDEVQYVITNIRNISINDKLSFNIECSSCYETISVDTDILDLCEYQENSYPIETDGIVWKDLSSKKSLEKICKEYPDDLPSDLEMLLHIKEYKGKEITSFAEIMEIVDEFTLQDNEDLYNHYDKVKSKFTISKDIVCMKCNSSDTYEFESIPGFFEPLLPPDMR